MSVSFFGDYNTTETVVIPFNSFTSDDPSASITLTNLLNTDIYIYKDGSLTQRTSSVGVAVDVDVDGIAGNHWVTIDLSDNTDAGFYVAGSRYQVRMEGVTIDAGTINAWIGAFSIGCVLRPAVDGNTLTCTGGNASINWGDISNATSSVSFTNTTVGTATAVTNTVKADIDTIKTQAVTCAAGVTINPSVGAATIQPTVTQFDARTLVAASYFDPTTDDVTLADGVEHGGATATFVLSDYSNFQGAAGSDRLLLVDTTIATLSTQTGFTLTAGSTDDDAYNGCTIVIEDASTSAQKAVGIIDDYTGSTKTVALLEDPGVFTMEALDKVYVLAEKAVKPTASANYHLDVSIDGTAGLDWNNISTKNALVDLAATTINVCDTVTTVTNGVSLANGAVTDASLAGNLEVVFETDFATNYNATRNAWATNVQDFVGTTASDPFNAKVIMGDWSDGGRLDLILDSILAMLDDARAEPGIGAPPVNPDAMTKLDYLYKNWRNKKEQTATTFSLYDDAGTTVDQQATVSDDTTTATKEEIVSG